MHLQLIKNAQVQPRRVQPGSAYLTLAKVFYVCAHLFLMAAGVDDPPDLGLNFKRKFRADVFLQSFYGKAKKIWGIWVFCSRRRVTKRFGFGFLAATSGNLWFMIICVTLWQHSTGKDRQRASSIASSVGIGLCCFVNTQYESQHLAARTWRISKGSSKLASAKTYETNGNQLKNV